MPKQYPNPPEMSIDPAKTYTATIETGQGEMVLELLPGDAPATVNNFVFLARDGFYDDGSFHRVISGFMIQGGCPEGTGRGGPGYRFNDEPVTRPYTRGTLAMANAGPQHQRQPVLHRPRGGCRSASQLYYLRDADLRGRRAGRTGWVSGHRWRRRRAVQSRGTSGYPDHPHRGELGGTASKASSPRKYRPVIPAKAGIRRCIFDARQFRATPTGLPPFTSA